MAGSKIAHTLPLHFFKSTVWGRARGSPSGPATRFGFIVAHLGVMFGGGVSLPLNPKFTREEMRHFLTDSGTAIVSSLPTPPTP